MADLERRSFLTSVLAGAGLALSYGLFGAYAVAYLFPSRPRRGVARLFIGRVTDFAPGSARPFVDQKGRALLVIAGPTGLEAFDTRCPHLGCRVHWEPKEGQFLCPCHQGLFDRSGKAIAGPPAAAGQSLERAPLDVDATSGTVFLRTEA